MSREELEKRILEARYNLVSSKDKETIDILEELAIKALEQEPILDKIRAEIASLSNANPSYWHSGDMVEREEVLDIIDKYKAESEPQESEDKE